METRRNSLHVLLMLIKRIGHLFGDEQITQVYQELLNRLNDSNDQILILAVQVFGEFLVICQQQLTSGQARIIYEPLFTHLDDSNEDVQVS